MNKHKAITAIGSMFLGQIFLSRKESEEMMKTEEITVTLSVPRALNFVLKKAQKTHKIFCENPECKVDKGREILELLLLEGLNSATFAVLKEIRDRSLLTTERKEEVK